MHNDARLPDVTFRTRVRDEAVGSTNPYRWQDVTTRDFFGGRRVRAHRSAGHIYADLLDPSAAHFRCARL